MCHALVQTKHMSPHGVDESTTSPRTIVFLKRSQDTHADIRSYDNEDGELQKELAVSLEHSISIASEES